MDTRSHGHTVGGGAPPKGRRGTSLIELMIVITIAGTLMYLAVSGFREQRQTSRNAVNVGALQTALRHCVSLAQRASSTASVVIGATQLTVRNAAGTIQGTSTRDYQPGSALTPSGTTLVCQPDGSLASGATVYDSSWQGKFPLGVSRLGQIGY